MSTRKLFFIWLGIRALAIALFTPALQLSLFVPFMASAAHNPLDPWTYWISSGGRSDAFPYGIVMFLVFLPSALLGNLITASFGSVSLVGNQILMACTLLILDFAICKLVGAFETKRVSWSLIWILSPLTLFISYAHGQLDSVPAFFLLLSCIFILGKNWRRAGVFLGLGIASKFSLVLVLPFLIIFFALNQLQRRNARGFLIGLVPGGILAIIPWFWSSGFHTMVIETPEVLKSVSFSVDFGNVEVLILPIAYGMLFLWCWNLGRISSFVLVAFLGASMLAVASLQVTSVGWYYWGLPLVAGTLREFSSRSQVLFVLWEFGIILYFSTTTDSFVNRFDGWHDVQLGETPKTLLFTVILVLAFAIISKILSESIYLGDYLRIGKKPLVISIAGDSGVGKDTLAGSVSATFGDSVTTILCGDDYHLHERGDLFWSTTTHLDPEANNLQEWGRHFGLAVKRKKVFARQYDHVKGRFTLPRLITPSDLIILNGLHPQLIPLAENIDLRVFITMEESLRVLLKLQRDLEFRGHSNQSQALKVIQARVEHFLKYVLPQRDSADLTFHLFQFTAEPLRITLAMTFFDASLAREIHAVVSSLGNVASSLEKYSEGRLTLQVDAWDLSDSDNHVIQDALLPEFQYILGDDAKPLEGLKGFMATVTTYALSRKRLVNNART